MATFFSRIAIFKIFLVFCLCFSDIGFLQGTTSLGINYGQLGNNLLPPEKVLDLLSSLKVTKARIYDTNPQILTAFANSGVELMVTIENAMLGQLMNPQAAFQWVSFHIKPYFPATKITSIAVGNEVFTDDDTTVLLSNLVPAMISIQTALAQLGLDSYIKVSTPCSLAVLEESYPPSAGSFKPEVAPVMTQMLQFLQSTKAPFWINAYPYFAYQGDPNRVSLDYVLFNPNQGMVDPFTKLHYDNMLYAQVDAAIYAMARLGFNGIEVSISETGWPSSGDSNEIGATLQNAAIYNRNLLRRQLENEGTPLRPQMRLEVYVFALFNENMKPGPTSERNYGLFHPDGTMAYNVGLSAKSTSRSPTSSSSSSSSSSSTTSSPSISEVFSSATEAATMEYHQSWVCWISVCMLTFHVFMGRPF